MHMHENHCQKKELTCKLTCFNSKLHRVNFTCVDAKLLMKFSNTQRTK